MVYGSGALKNGAANVKVKLNGTGKRALAKAKKRGLTATLKIEAVRTSGESVAISKKVKLTPAKSRRR